MPGYLVAPLRLLLDRGHGSTDPPRVRITESGLAHYRELCRRRALWLATDRSVPFGLEVHS